MVRFHFVVFLALGISPAAWACHPINFLTKELPEKTHSSAVMALLTAYGDLQFDPGTKTFATPDGTRLPLGALRDISPKERLKNPTIAEQFTYTYSLAFDLTARAPSFVDPGRLRNSALFEALYFSSKSKARQSLTTLRFRDGAKASFQVTTHRRVDCQLWGAISALSDGSGANARYFTKIGGSFNWRRISGTDRLSTHSFGIAVDLNTQLGQYWKWAGAKAGQVGAYDNKFPQHLVETFERFGFIWGGKWHHYDGMHFEYRPEMILHARFEALK